jgi:hypothetical protein
VSGSTNCALFASAVAVWWHPFSIIWQCCPGTLD